ncbi:MAG: M20/M25/M40 family metallo-hydrolase, partial [Acidobacteriota bacterium]
GCAADPDGSAPAEAAATLQVVPEDVANATRELQRQIQTANRAYEIIESVTVEVGPRLAGSEGDRRAVAWAEAKLRDLGFANVRTEPVTVPHWERGHAIAQTVSPYPQPMVVAALGGSVGTPAGGIEAEVVRVTSLDELATLDRAAVARRIVFIDEEMERTATGAGYGPAVAKRVGGAVAAAEKGAVAVIIRSVGTSINRIAHTGTMRYSDEVERIPAAALSNPDADVLAAQIALGEPVVFRLDLGCEYFGEKESANVIGEIVGAEYPDEIVLVVAHLDSWDLGTGAIDDGSGIGIVTEAARQIGLLSMTPKRTVRVLLTANEEFGLSGARAYAERYELDMASHVGAVEADFGADHVISFRSWVADSDLPLIQDIATLLEPLDVPYDGNTGRGGADLIPLRPLGVPVFDLSQDGTKYFDTHHTINDTLDRIDPEGLTHNVAAYATLAWVLAAVEPGLERAPEPPAR